MLFSFTLKDGIVYLPTMAKTEAGFYMRREPVAVVPAANTEALRCALQDVMDRGNAVIPTPKRDSFPPPVLPKYAGARSWSAFMNGASEWAIDERDGVYQIIPYRKDPDGGPSWVPDRKGQIDLPAGTKRDDVIDRMIAIVQETARR
jgi:hypothetical protein